MINRWLFIFVVVLIGLFGADANALDSIKTVVQDNSAVHYRPVSADKMESYKQMKAYNYERFQKPESQWAKFKRWLWSKLSYGGVSHKIIVYLIIGLAVIILLFVILKLLDVELTGLFILANKHHISKSFYSQKHPDIYSRNIDDRLAMAIKNKDFRQAVRFMYLLSLRQLDTLGLIQWQPWKTNKEYCHELTSPGHKQSFTYLQLSYEYIWYGQFTVEEEQFNKVRTQFKDFNRAIGNKQIQV
ncbi:protein of unknown function [Saccharicrinis carchari]|uniref:Protein-glutamine gamma-glutamyltransferase-like C-terminal domain-containing protein n=1 Tax=Saccharicrinis carchari TaxID=1168039 RepID=A0A521ESB0_SACCC|nr:DUF4129 domain-containing protein [Saccharicrinis carchari]SMO85980.1 protein of unknown function [Saccharicrinis carchari]